MYLAQRWRPFLQDPDRESVHLDIPGSMYQVPVTPYKTLLPKHLTLRWQKKYFRTYIQAVRANSGRKIHRYALIHASKQRIQPTEYHTRLCLHYSRSRRLTAAKEPPDPPTPYPARTDLKARIIASPSTLRSSQPPASY